MDENASWKQINANALLVLAAQESLKYKVVLKKSYYYIQDRRSGRTCLCPTFVLQAGAFRLRNCCKGKTWSWVRLPSFPFRLVVSMAYI